VLGVSVTSIDSPVKGRKPRFYFVEPSKVGTQHITVIEGFLHAIVASRKICSDWSLDLWASSSTLESLSREAVGKFKCRSIVVMDPAKRRLVLKCVVELIVVLRCMWQMRRGDVLFISCMLPPSLLLLEIANWFFRVDAIHVVLHGEVEGLLGAGSQKVGSLGFWARLWLRSRGRASRISLVVLDDFIRARLLADHPEKLRAENLLVVYMPVSAEQVVCGPCPGVPRICFIGYRTKDKSFSDFVRLSRLQRYAQFVAIGGGFVEDVVSGVKHALGSVGAFHEEISVCTLAIFPYTSGYNCSISASAMDALATGVPIAALRRPCFMSLEQYFGADLVKTYESLEDMALHIDHLNVEDSWRGKEGRLSALAGSKYGNRSVRESFERLLSSASTNW